MPLQTASGGVFNLFVLHISSRTLYILDPHPLPDEFKIQSLRKCTAIIQWVSTVLSKVMEVSCPWWKDDLIHFDHRVADDGQFDLVTTFAMEPHPFIFYYIYTIVTI